MSTSCEIRLSWIPQDTFAFKSTLVQVMALCHQASGHYPEQYWHRSMSPYGATTPQWVNFGAPRYTWYIFFFFLKFIYSQMAELMKVLPHKNETNIPCIVNTLAANDLVIQGSEAPAALVLDQNATIVIHESALEYVACKMSAILFSPQYLNTLRPKQNRCHFEVDIFGWTFREEDFLYQFQIDRYIPIMLMAHTWISKPKQSSTKPNLVAKILATKFGFVPDC